MHLHSNYSKPELGRNSLVVLPGGIVQALSHARVIAHWCHMDACVAVRLAVGGTHQNDSSRPFEEPSAPGCWQCKRYPQDDRDWNSMICCVLLDLVHHSLSRFSDLCGQDSWCPGTDIDRFFSKHLGNYGNSHARVWFIQAFWGTKCTWVLAMQKIR